MTRDQIEAQVKDIFIKNFGEEALERLTTHPAPFRAHDDPDRRMNDLDSLDHVEFILAIEDHFNIEIDDVSAALVKTLTDAVNAVDTRLSRPLHGAQ